MNDRGQWLFQIESTSDGAMVDGLVPVAGYKHDGRPPEEVAMMEKARSYRAHSVFFEAGRNGRSPVAQALVFGSQGPADDTEFAELHKRLWSWGGVPLIYRKTPGLIQLFRCAHKPDFVSSAGKLFVTQSRRCRSRRPLPAMKLGGMPLNFAMELYGMTPRSANRCYPQKRPRKGVWLTR